MNAEYKTEIETKPGRLIAVFGQAELIVHDSGRTELRGGTKSDLADAREWISLFLHEAAPHLRLR